MVDDVERGRKMFDTSIIEDPFPEGGTLLSPSFARQHSDYSSGLPSPRLSGKSIPSVARLRRRCPWLCWRTGAKRFETRHNATGPQQEEWLVGKSRFFSFGESSLEMSWEGLSMCSWQGVGKGGKPVNVLEDVSGNAKSSHLTCILGPSGSGKTTLLNVLAGRQSGGSRHKIRITGKVWASGQRIDPRMVRSRVAYVLQKDEMFATATPREALHFSAALRLSGPQQDRDGLVHELLGSLGLLRCADTYIGNAVINGLSGGQRKRTSIGVELITRPDIVCLDEPTSGLDSYAAYQVVKVLKDLASAGCTVICTLHQPSSEIFALVDRVILLNNGRSLYDGDREQMVQHFAQIGYKVPVGFNPADFVIFMMQTEPPDRLGEIIEAWAKKRVELPALDRYRSLSSSFSGGPTELCTTPKRGARSRFSSAGLRVSQKACSKQLQELVRRELRAAVRDRTTMTVRFCLAGVLALFFGMIFQDVGQTILEEQGQSTWDMIWTGLTAEEIRALRQRKLEWHFNAVVNVALVAMFSACQPVILTFPLERAVFLREHSSGTYTVLPYYFSKMAVEVPLVFVQSLLTLSLCYVVMSLNGDFFAMLWTMVLLSLCSVAVALAIGCSVRQPKETGAIGPLIFVPQMLFSGVFIPVSHMPYYLRWMQYGSFLQYAIKVLGIVEFKNVPHRMMLLDSQDIDENSIMLYIGLLVLLVLLFSLFGIEMLRRRSKHFF